MEVQKKPENLYIRRNRLLTAITGIFLIAIAAGAMWLMLYAVHVSKPESEFFRVFVIVCTAIWAAVMVLCALLNFRNLFYPCLLSADEKGITDYSGYCHFGFISWQDIEDVRPSTALKLDLHAGNKHPCVWVYMKDLKKFKKSLSPLNRTALIFCECAELPTVCARGKMRDIAAALKIMLDYYKNER